MAEGFYNVSEITEAEGYKWYRIGLDRWCAQVDKVTFLKGSASKTYKVLFPYVSAGDRDKLIDLAQEAQLRIIVEEN